MHPTRRRLLGGLAGTLATTAWPHAARAQAAWPTKPLRLLVNFAAGGTTDVMARAMAKALQPVLGQPVVVDNKTGALGAIGAAEVARAAPDGHTVLLTTQGSLTEIPVLSPQTPYDPVAAFAPITLVGESPLVLFAHPSLPVNDVKALIDYARSRPDGVDIAVTGSSVKMGAYALAGAGNFKLTLIPYGGQGPALNALLGGHTPLALNTSSTALMQHVQAGRLKLLGVASDGPYKLMPGVPSVAQTVPGYTASAWWGLFAPAGTPATAIDTWNRAVRRVLADPEIEALFAANAVVPRTSTPAELRAMVTGGLERTRTLVARYDIKPD